MSKIGVKRGDHVATLFGPGNGWIITKYALHILGAVIIPVNVNLKVEGGVRAKKLRKNI